MNRVDWRNHLRAQVRPVVYAAAAMTPGITLLLLALGHAGSYDWIEWLAIIPVAIILCFVVSLVMVALLAPPASIALASFGRSTGVAHAAVGAGLALFLFGSYVLGAWFLVEPGPFSLSLPEQVELTGTARAILKGLLCAADLALCGAVAGYVYWFKLHSAGGEGGGDLTPSLSGDP